MDLDLLPGGSPVRAEVRALLDARHDRSDLDRLLGAPPGYDATLWRELGRRGWLGFGLPEQAGGHGALADLAVVIEELGRARVPSPVHSGLVQAVGAVARAAPPAEVADRLRGVVDGAVRVALCLPGPTGAVTPGSFGARCVAEGSGVRVSGAKRYVPYADSAETLLVVADGPGDGVSLLAVAAAAEGVRVEPAPSIGGDRQAEVGLRDVYVDADGVVGRPGVADAAVRWAVLVGTALLCAEAVGASAALVEQTTARAMARSQFGAPIAGLQVVQHRCADMAMDHLAALGALDEAVASLDAGGPADAEVAAAKASCGAACLRVAASAHQIWGGTGYLADAGLHHWTRLIKGIDGQLGGAREQRRRLVSVLRDSGGWSSH